MRTARIKEGYGTIQRDVMCMPVSVYAKAVYALFVSYTGQKDCCYPAIRTICKNLSLSRPTVIKAIKELEAVNLLEVERALGEGSIYYPNYLLQSHINENVPIGKPDKANEPTLFVDHQGESIYVGFDDYVDENEKEHKGFWSCYDKKVDKKKTTKSWAKLSQKIKGVVMSKIPLYKAHQPDRKYRKSPYSYLINECWEDDDLHKPYSKNEQSLGQPTEKLSTTW